MSLALCLLESLSFLLWLAGLTAIAAVYLAIVFYHQGGLLADSFMKIADLFTDALPPALRATMSVSLAAAAARCADAAAAAAPAPTVAAAAAAGCRDCGGDEKYRKAAMQLFVMSLSILPMHICILYIYIYLYIIYIYLYLSISIYIYIFLYRSLCPCGIRLVDFIIISAVLASLRFLIVECLHRLCLSL